MSYNGENIATAQADGNKEESDNFALKILVSNKDAGSIIGKGGATINQLQVDSGARVKLSQSHELFPGTSDRIVLLTGSFDAVIKAHTMIMRKLHVRFQYSVRLFCKNFLCPFLVKVLIRHGGSEGEELGRSNVACTGRVETG